MASTRRWQCSAFIKCLPVLRAGLDSFHIKQLWPRRARGFSFVASITTLHFSWCSSQIFDEAQLPHSFSGHFQKFTDSRIPSPTSELYHTFFSTSFNLNTIKLTNVKFTVWWDLTNRYSLNNYLKELFHYPSSSLLRSIPASHPTRWNHRSAFCNYIFPFPQSSYKWNHTLYDLPCLASFIQHDVFEIHPCHCMHW